MLGTKPSGQGRRNRWFPLALLLCSPVGVTVAGCGGSADSDHGSHAGGQGGVTPHAGTSGSDAAGADTGGASTGGSSGSVPSGATGGSNTGGSDIGGSSGNVPSGGAAGLVGGSGGASGGVPSGGTAGEVGGSAGSGATVNRLVLDPDTLVFYSPDTAWIGAAVTGYDPRARACATLAWFAPRNELALGATCDSDPENWPQVMVHLDQDGPCGPEQLPYDWVTPSAAEGCIDYSEMSGSGIDLVDAVVEVSTETFTGQIVADNRSSREPRPVSFGLVHWTDTPENVFVQTLGRDGRASWIRVFRGGEPVQIFPPCLRDCVTGEAAPCAGGEGVVERIVWDDTHGAGFVTWPGFVCELSADESCYTEVAAPEGAYQVEFCFGRQVLPMDSGDWVESPTCVTEDFTLPTETVVAVADYGG